MKKLNEAKTDLIEKNYASSTSATHIVLPILLELLLVGLLFLRSRVAMMQYLYALVPLLLITALIGTYIYNRDGDMRLFGAIASLCAIGIALQLLIDQAYYPASSFSLLKYAISFAIGLLFVLFYIIVRKLFNIKAFSYLLMLVTLCVYIYLYFYGIDPNGYGTTAWIQIKSFTFQLTDITKISAVLFYASLFRTEKNPRSILIISTIFFFINFIGSVLIHELGSFFILYFLHLAMLFIFMPKGKEKRIYLLTVASITLFLLASAFLLYRTLRPLAEANQLNAITSLLYPIAKKVYLRFSVAANIDADPLGAGYQLVQARKVLMISGLFGNTINFNALPVVESDMAFIACINSFGLLFGILCVYLFLRIMISGGEISRKLVRKHYADAIVCYGFAVLLFAQAMLVILGSCNIIPLAGLPIPFLSRGGSYLAIVFSFSGILLHLSMYPLDENEYGGLEDEKDN